MTFSCVPQAIFKRALKAFMRGKEGGLLKIVCKSTATWVCQKPLFTEIHVLDTRSCADVVRPEFFDGTMCEP